ncbi:MAG: GGDEF domain-containing protein [Hyphomicrobiales bacterium]|nr:GGDEF domain-containing protein [Hyphomicrobiales bacterium]
MVTLRHELGGCWRTNQNPAIFLKRAATELDMALQPIVDMNTGAVYGHEALMRGFGNLGFDTIPDVLGFAHRLGVLGEFDCILREKALSKFTSVPGYEHQKLFFNLDGRLLETSDLLPGETERLLTGYGVVPNNFCFELSEAYDNASAKCVDGIVGQFALRGFRFALDDFGRGISELKVLYDHHPDFVKIDRFFIQNIEQDSRKRLFVSTVVDLSHLLGQKVIAEGVETEPELLACREAGCDLVQGYFVSRPFLETESALANYGQVALAQGGSDAAPKSDREFVRKEIKPVEAIVEGTRLHDVLEAFRKSADQAFFPVVDRQGEPRGLIRETDIKELIYSPFGRDLVQNRGFRLDTAAYVHKCPIADINSDPDRLIDLIAEDSSEGVIITKGMKYAGFISAHSLLKLTNQKRLRQAQEQNPLTRLPGNTIINEFIARAAATPATDRFLCYLDLDNFKPFNDTYGFRIGDRAILLLADLMRTLLSEQKYVLGHVGGDDFFVGIADGRDAAVMKKMTALIRRFARSAESLYESSHRQQGYIVGNDRLGRERRFPLLSCSVAVLKVPAGRTVEDPDLITRQIAEIKSRVKSDHSQLLIETLQEDRSPPAAQPIESAAS